MGSGACPRLRLSFGTIRLARMETGEGTESCCMPRTLARCAVFRRPDSMLAFAASTSIPPFNSGRRFAEYDDTLAPSVWLAMMRERLEAARALLSEDGAIFVEIDDTGLGPLQVVMNDVFGRDQRVATITVVRSAATGHKAKNRGPVNVADYILVYAKDRAGGVVIPSYASAPATMMPTERGSSIRTIHRMHGVFARWRPTSAGR